MKKIILERREYGWSAMFFGMDPEDIEIPLPFTPLAYLQTVAKDMRRRFPTAMILYRDHTEYLTQVAQ